MSSSSNFWTLTCINWLRQEPYVRAWSQAYRDDGLVVIGVHTPEFSFEHEIDRVRRAIDERAIDYPVAIDNDYAVWSAFDNHYWPALYFVDADGHHPRPPLRRGALRGVRARDPAAARRRARARPRRRGSASRRRPTGTTCARPRPISATRAARTSRHRRRRVRRTPRLRAPRAPAPQPLGPRRRLDDRARECRARPGRREHRFPVPRARRPSRAVRGAHEPIPFRVLSTARLRARHTASTSTRTETACSGRPPLPTRAPARRGPRADARDHVPRARRRGVRVHVRVGPSPTQPGGLHERHRITRACPVHRLREHSRHRRRAFSLATSSPCAA